MFESTISFPFRKKFFITSLLIFDDFCNFPVDFLHIACPNAIPDGPFIPPTKAACGHRQPGSGFTAFRADSTPFTKYTATKPRNRLQTSVFPKRYIYFSTYFTPHSLSGFLFI